MVFAPQPWLARLIEDGKSCSFDVAGDVKCPLTVPKLNVRRDGQELGERQGSLLD
jgi:hypothetical protein